MEKEIGTLLTYEQAKQISNYYKNFNFSESLFKINNYKIASFSYFLATYNYFLKPIPTEDFNAFNMRGMTFVFNEDGSLWKRFLMLPKFFNLNQVETTQYDVVKNKKIELISIKEDGSLIAFMMTPDENLFAKTISGFTNEMAIKAMSLLNENIENVKWVTAILKLDYTPLFEYVSFDNRIVLNYSGSALRFIGLRGNISGEFIPAITVKELNLGLPDSIQIINSEKYTLDELIEKSKTEKEKEGWVIKFTDGQLIKIKTLWYWLSHNLRTENIFREDYIITVYLTDKLDEIISQLDKTLDQDALVFINKVVMAVNKYSTFIDEHVSNLYLKLCNEYNSDFKAYATNCCKLPFFGLSKYYSDTDKYRKVKIEFILKNANRLNLAKELVRKYS